ncbi:MAG: leucine-rich repeat domain-containing protein [Clostridia bacterium]|nr:leucine-rich repeat domain-containing protein [Clostridia bacterium]
MKRFRLLPLCFSLCLAVGVNGIAAGAAVFDAADVAPPPPKPHIYLDGNYTYALTNGQASIAKYHGDAAWLAIPDQWNGIPITAVGEGAFYARGGLTAVTIPSSITSIGPYAFCGCDRLHSVLIPSGCTSIGVGAFSVCASLARINVMPENPAYASVDGVLFSASQTTLVAYPAGRDGSVYVIPEGVRHIGGGAFSGCNRLDRLSLAEGVSLIDEYAFSLCSQLESITIPGSCSSIGAYAFFRCDRLQRVTIRSGCASIGNKAFYDCENLSQIIIPDSVACIGEGAFTGCKNLTFTVSEGSCGLAYARENNILYTIAPSCPGYDNNEPGST